MSKRGISCLNNVQEFAFLITALKVDVEPELESDFRKRTGVKLFIRSSAPAHVPATQINRSPASKPPGN